MFYCLHNAFQESSSAGLMKNLSRRKKRNGQCRAPSTGAHSLQQAEEDREAAAAAGLHFASDCFVMQRCKMREKQRG
jgi:hypothetical protein